MEIAESIAGKYPIYVQHNKQNQYKANLIANLSKGYRTIALFDSIKKEYLNKLNAEYYNYSKILNEKEAKGDSKYLKYLETYGKTKEDLLEAKRKELAVISRIIGSEVNLIQKQKNLLEKAAKENSVLIGCGGTYLHVLNPNTFVRAVSIEYLTKELNERYGIPAVGMWIYAPPLSADESAERVLKLFGNIYTFPVNEADTSKSLNNFLPPTKELDKILKDMDSEAGRLLIEFGLTKKDDEKAMLIRKSYSSYLDFIKTLASKSANYREFLEMVTLHSLQFYDLILTPYANVAEAAKSKIYDIIANPKANETFLKAFFKEGQELFRSVPEQTCNTYLEPGSNAELTSFHGELKVGSLVPFDVVSCPNCKEYHEGPLIIKSGEVSASADCKPFKLTEDMIPNLFPKLGLTTAVLDLVGIIQISNQEYAIPTAIASCRLTNADIEKSPFFRLVVPRAEIADLGKRAVYRFTEENLKKLEASKNTSSEEDYQNRKYFLENLLKSYESALPALLIEDDLSRLKRIAIEKMLEDCTSPVQLKLETWKLTE
jgi:hypothetical protein